MINITNIIQNYPRTSIIILSFLVTFFITLVTTFMVDKKRMKEIREKQKRLKEEMKKFRDNPEKMMEINKQMIEDMPEQLKHSFKPMLVTIIPLIILFKWLKTAFAVTSIASSWFWWYIGASILFSMLLRKIFGLQ